MRAYAAPIALAAAALLLTGCGAGTESDATDESEQTQTEQAEQETQEAPAFDVTTATAEDFDTALSALVEEVGADPADITDFQVTLSSVIIYAVDPEATDELNAWEYRDGEVASQPTPVDYGGDAEALEQNLFSTDDISTEAVASALAESVELSGIEDGEVDGIVMKRMLPTSTDLFMQTGVRSDRESANVRFEADGTFTEVL
ncbi:hypothetical protein [Microbacterium halophytorum]|uniref:hypothetical protein n=1 Tax=Microbacterium halophytorum TaxID=2067568 RepID=UPI00131A1017|nr:hypothetical protein [Microbacterium halophytorum]